MDHSDAWSAFIYSFVGKISGVFTGNTYSCSTSLATMSIIAAAAPVDLSYYAPSQTVINSLSSAINGTGVYGYIFNSSSDPAGVPYGTYNWCNMPHVRPQEYVVPSKDYKLEYVEVVCSEQLLRASQCC